MNQLYEKFNNIFNIEVDFIMETNNLVVNEEEKQITQDFSLLNVSKTLNIYDKKQKKVIYSNIFTDDNEDSLNKDIQDEIVKMYDLWLHIKGSYYDFLFNMEIERLKLNN